MRPTSTATRPSTTLSRIHGIPFVLLLLATTACAPLEKTNISRVITSGRDGWQHPERVVDALALEEGDRVAEIGAGDGYWLEWLSKAVGPTGRVYAVEVEETKVEKLRRKKADDSLDNVIVVHAGYTDPNLPDGEIDLAMTCLTYHHIDEQVDYFRRLQVDLAPGGRVAHLDDRDDTPAPFSWLQSEGHWTNAVDMVREMESAGYTRTQSFDFLPVQSFQVFEPAAKIAASAGPALPAQLTGH